MYSVDRKDSVDSLKSKHSFYSEIFNTAIFKIMSYMKSKKSFDVLLTVHLSIFILVINQLDAQNFVLQEVYFMPLHVSSTMCSSSGGQNCIMQPLVSSQL